MRKIFIILMLLPCFSCTDWLNVESEKSVTYLNYFKSESDLEKVLISIFGYEKALYAPANPEAFGYVGLLCDVAGARKGYKELNVLDFYSNQYMEGWSRYYSLIYLVNMLEENRYRFENISEERTDYWIAQANFAKALAYFTLAQKWGEAPMAPSTESIDVVGKSSVEDILQEAIRCAEIALSLPTHENLTDANGEAVTSKQYASLGSVHTLLANIYAWMGGLYGETSYWEKAESHASQVIDGKVGFYKLEGDIKSVVNNTLGGNRKSDETIFTIEVNSQDDNKYSSAWFSAIYPGQSLIDYPYDHASPEALETNTDKPRILVNTVYNIFLEEKDQRRKEYWKELGEASYEGSTWEEDPRAVFYEYGTATNYNYPTYLPSNHQSHKLTSRTTPLPPISHYDDSVVSKPIDSRPSATIKSNYLYTSNNRKPPHLKINHDTTVSDKPRTHHTNTRLPASRPDFLPVSSRDHSYSGTGNYKPHFLSPATPSPTN